MIDESYITRLKVDEKIRNNIKNILDRKNMTMKDLSNLDDSIDYGFLRQIMQGNRKSISSELAHSISRGLGVELAEIYNGVLTFPSNEN